MTTVAPGLARSPALTVEAVHLDRPVPVYFERVVREVAEDPSSPRRGQGRFHKELWVLSRVGVEVTALTPSGRNAARFLYDGLFPFVVLALVSRFTRRPDRRRTDLFFGKMKTPVGATPELEVAGMAATAENPGRFDDTKLLGRDSNWEFTKWNRVDAVGFIACLAVSFGILAAFWLVLKWASGAL
jgi:hypothetical protein